MLFITLSFTLSCKTASDLNKKVDFTCKGDSPFWTAIIAKDGIVFTQLGGAEKTFPYVQPEESGGRTVYVSKKGDTWLRISLTKGNCFNSAAGKQYPYKVELALGDVVYQGCGE